MGKLLAGLEAVTQKRVLIGVPAEKAGRQDDDEKGEINNAALMYIHDKGATEANIPARPGLTEGVKDALPDIEKELVALAKEGLSGDPAAVDKRLHRAGIIGQNAVRKRIVDGPWAPLAPSTIAARKRKAKKSGVVLEDSDIRPLRESGQMYRAVTYSVRDKGEK